MNLKVKSLIEISFVILTGFIANYLAKKYEINFFLFAHLIFLLVAVVIRSFISNWKIADYGVMLKNFKNQLFNGLILLIIVLAYYSFLNLLTPLIPESEKIGAQIFNISTKERLIQKITRIAFIKAGFIESLRYFSYIQGLLMQTFNKAMGGFMTFVYFSSSHMGIMNLITLPVNFLFVYYYRTYKLIIPIVVLHIFADSISFTGMYLSYKGYYFYNVIFFLIILILFYFFRSRIRALIKDITSTVKEDYTWLWGNKYKAILVSLILPIWLHLLLYIDRMI